jgi:hypothetical protein
MVRTVLLAALAVLFAQGVAFGQIVELEGRYWFTDLSASIKAERGSLPATDIDMGDDLGLKSANAPEGRLTFLTGPNSRIRLAYTRLDFEGEKTVGRTITFDGNTFAANSRMASDLEIQYGRLGWIWEPLGIPKILKFGGILEAKGFLIDASLRTRGATPETKESATLPLVLPTLGLALDLTIYPKVHLFAEASGLPAGDLGHIVDAEAGLRFSPLPIVTLSAGYRLFDMRVEDGGDRAKLRLYGPFVGASLRF